MKVSSINVDELQDLNFSTNWNRKLYSPCFSSIRLQSDKYHKGKFYNVMLKKSFITIVHLSVLIPFKLENLNESMSLLDTGYNLATTTAIIKKMYPNVKDWNKQILYYMVFEAIKMDK